MTAIVAFILVLGVLIFIHELGHFLVAKWAGVGVEVFSLGFGPRIFSYTYGETEYRVSIFPLGGYVKMVGESPEEGEDGEGTGGEEVAAPAALSEEDRERSFTNKPLSKRVLIVLAGPIMNLALAALLFPVIYLLGVEIPAYLDRPTEVGYVIPGEAGEKQGIRQGDFIYSVAGRDVATWEDFFISVALDPERDLSVKVRRDGESLDLNFKGGEAIGVYPLVTLTIGDVLSGGAAGEAGLVPGDVLVAMDGEKLGHWAALLKGINEEPGEKELQIDRGGETLTVMLTPKYYEDDDIYRIGVTYSEEMVTKKFGLVGAVKEGTKRALDLTVLLFEVIKGLVLGELSTKTLGGPILIAQVAGKAAETGLTELITLVAFLSLQLGIINLFPIPILDGGHLTFYAIEFIKGKPLSDRVIGYAQQVGFVMLMALMLLVTWNDLVRVWPSISSYF